jgi:hypothetical protein
MERGDAGAPYGSEGVLACVLERLEDRGEREVMSLWLRGWTLKAIAEELGVEHDAMRMRLGKIKEKSLAVLATEDLA